MIDPSFYLAILVVLVGLSLVSMFRVNFRKELFGRLRLVLVLANLVTLLICVVALVAVLAPADLPDIDVRTRGYASQLVLKQSMLDGINRISYSDLLNSVVGLGFSGSDYDTVGSYLPVYRVVNLAEGSDAGVLAHEVGHHVWFYHLGRVQRERFAVLFERGDHPTSYAASSVEEDFAESFELYALNQGRFLDDDRREFVEQVYSQFS